MIKIALGETGHRRHGAIANHFSYPLFYLRFDLQNELELKTELRRRFRLFSLRAENYLAGRAGTLEDNARSFIAEKCEGYRPKKISLMTMPTVLGYGFNPISFWICENEGRIEAVLCEVNNTFHERHFYWIKPESEGAWTNARKDFHVSPFFAMDGRYRFRFQQTPAHTRIDIRYENFDGEPNLSTWLETNDRDLAGISPWWLYRTYGWLSLKVIVRIHWQALRLFLKRAKFYSKPAPPASEVTK